MKSSSVAPIRMALPTMTSLKRYAMSVASRFTGIPSSLPSSLMMSVSPTPCSWLHSPASAVGTVSIWPSTISCSVFRSKLSPWQQCSSAISSFCLMMIAYLSMRFSSFTSSRTIPRPESEMFRSASLPWAAGLPHPDSSCRTPA
ncbi:hypothetical protein 2209_scaffold64_00117 [Bacteriophage sp.]|nr:hypothetical protein 2209_scaffold64_00117 [Bacteriophage sp.]